MTRPLSGRQGGSSAMYCWQVCIGNYIISCDDDVISSEGAVTCPPLSLTRCRYLPDLPDHLPDDCGARCGSLCIPAPPAGPRHGHHLLCHADQNQPHLPHLWTGQEVGDPAQIHQPHIPAGHHLHPHLCPGESTGATWLPVSAYSISSHDSHFLFSVCAAGPRCVCVVWRRPPSHHYRLWRAPPSEPWPGPGDPEVWHVWLVNHLLPQLQHRSHGNTLTCSRYVNDHLIEHRFIDVARQPLSILLVSLLGNVYGVRREESWRSRDVQRSKTNWLHYVHNLHRLARIRTHLLWYRTVHREGKNQAKPSQARSSCNQNRVYLRRHVQKHRYNHVTWLTGLHRAVLWWSALHTHIYTQLMLSNVTFRCWSFTHQN